MAQDRTTIIHDPGQIVFGGATFYSGDSPITVELVEDQFRPVADGFGPQGVRATDRRVEVRASLAGEIESLSVLFPYGDTAMGVDIFGASDSSCVVYGRTSGRSITIHNAAITQMPSLSLGHDRTAFGEVVITGLIANSTASDNAAAMFTEASAVYPGDTGFDPSAMKSLGQKATWGSSPWDEFYSEGGFEVSFDLQLVPKRVDGHGTVGMSLAGLGVNVSGRPIGPTMADVLAAMDFQGSGNALGEIKPTTNLVIQNQISGSHIYFIAYNATMSTDSHPFSASEANVGPVTWEANRSLTSGALDDLFYIGTAAPA